MKQGVLLKLTSSILLLSIYLYLYDPSTSVFYESMINVVALKLSFSYVFCLISWLFGFIGLISFYHSGNRKVRIVFWGVFFVSYSINFAYQNIFNLNLSLANISKIVDISDRLNDINTGKLLQFIIVNAVFYVLSKFLGPIGINSHKYFIFSLFILSALSVGIYSYEKTSVAMQAIYTTPLVLIVGMMAQVLGVAKSKVFF